MLISDIYRYMYTCMHVHVYLLPLIDVPIVYVYYIHVLLYCWHCKAIVKSNSASANLYHMCVCI